MKEWAVDTLNGWHFNAPGYLNGWHFNAPGCLNG